MLSRDQINAYLSVIIETVYESGDAGCISGHLYAAMMSRVTLDEYNGLLSVAKQADILTESGHVLRLTDKGRMVLAKLLMHRAVDRCEKETVSS
jgi:hypothetical protein